MTRIKRRLSWLLCGGLGIAVVSTAALAAPTKVKPAVQGKIKAIARTPRPGSVPYKDAVVAIYLTNVKPLQGKFSRRTILVYTWGMRNSKLAPAASYRAGQTIKLSLQPWDRVEGKYGRYQRIELDDDKALALDAFWGEALK